MTEATESWVAARELDRRVVTVWTVQDAIGYGVLALLVLAADIGARLGGVEVPGPPGLAAGLLAVAGGVAAWWLPRARHRHWRYHVAADALELRHGILKRVHSAIRAPTSTARADRASTAQPIASCTVQTTTTRRSRARSVAQAPAAPGPSDSVSSRPGPVGRVLTWPARRW